MRARTTVPPSPFMRHSWTGSRPTCNSGGRVFHVPQEGSHAFSQPHAEAEVAEISLQPSAIPVAGAQMHGAVGTRAVAIFAPVLARQGGHVQRRARQPAQICDGPRSVAIVE